MGNTHVQGARKFLESEPKWEEYYGAEWRSERAKELDRHGGPGRPPVARGDSVTAKLVFLEGALKHEQRRMKHVLQVSEEEKQRRDKGPLERPPDIILNTDLRAYERLTSAEAQRAEVAAQRAAEEEPSGSGGAGASGSASTSSSGAYMSQQQKDFSLLAKDPELRKKMLEQRKRMMQYAAGVNVLKGAPGIKALNLPAIRSKVAANWKDNGHGSPGDGGADGEGGEGGAGGLWSAPQPAEWRQRVHAARRRTMLLVAAAARWQVALSRRPGPKRLPRVNSFSYYIPQVLGDEAPRFIEEAKAVAKIKADAAARMWEPDHPGKAEAETPARAGHGPARRGMSDCGFAAAADAAAAAAHAAGASSVAAPTGAGAVSPGPLAGGIVRPRRLTKSSSDKALRAASLPEGHASDAEVTYGAAGRRPRSGSCISAPRLPAIGSGGHRISSTGAPSAVPGDTTPPPPLAPRLPRAKLGRAASGRAGRRQSDSAALAAAAAAKAAGAPSLPPALAAAAAAGAAVLAGGEAGGGGAAASGSVAAIIRGARSRSRASENGSSRPRRDGSESGGHPPMAGLHHARASGSSGPSAASGATGAGTGTGTCSASSSPKPKRRSEAGAAGGLQAPDSPGFLPRIPGGSGGGAGSGGSAAAAGGAVKPMTVAQARRLALMSEMTSGGGAGPDDLSRLNNMSPSRLGPLKLAPGVASARSPDKPLASPGAVSILDNMRTPRGEQRESGLVAGGSRELKEALAVALAVGGIGGDAVDGAVGSTGGGAPAGIITGVVSPVLSPGLHRASATLDSVALGAGPSPELPHRSARSEPALLSPGLTATTAGAAADAAGDGPGPPSGLSTPQPPAVGLSSSDPAGPSGHAGDADGPAAAPTTSSPAALAASHSPQLPTPVKPTQAQPVAATLSPSLSSPAPAPVPTPASPSPLAHTSATIHASSSAPALSPPHPALHALGKSPERVASPPTGLPPLPPSHAGKRPPHPSTSAAGGVAERAQSARVGGVAASSNGCAGGGAAGAAAAVPERAHSARPGSSANSASAASAAAALGLDAAAAGRLAKATQLMSMYANRVNAQWAEAQQWAPPHVASATEQESFCASDAWVPYKVTAQRLLKTGGLAVHIDACADTVTLPDGSSMDVWTSDPWVLVQKLRPGSLPLSERIEGVPLGARALQQLVLCVEALAGREAVAKLTVVLAINDDQRNAVVADIIRSRAYGLKPENLILTAQRKRCGYRYDRDAQAFLEDPATPAHVLGGGFSLCQLAWLGDAFCVSASGELVMLMGRTLLERFAAGRVEWLLCRRARDLALLAPGGPLDLQGLAYALYAADRHGGNMVLQAAPASSLTVPRAYDSTLLSLKSHAAAASVPSPSRRTSVAGAAAGVDGGGGGAAVVDLRSAELSSPVMVEALAAVKRQAGHEGWVGLQRYLMHVPTLHGMLNTMGLFRPKLTMAGDVARMSLEAADITADPRAACVAVAARSSPAILTSPNEVDDLIPLLLAQDRSAAFRDILAASLGDSNGDAGAGVTGAAGGGASGAQIVSAPAALASKPGIRILLFVAANDVTQLAVNLVLLMARPGRDVVHLVTVVHNNLAMPTGQALVLKFLKQISNAMIEAHAEVLVKGLGGLLEVMEGAAARLAPQLVVMASAALTMSNLNTASVMGSVTLSVLKRLTLPVAVATSNSKALVLTQRRTALRCMAVVDATSRPALHFLCASCMEPLRGDRLVLAAHHPTRQMTTQQAQTYRRMVDNFADIASSHRFHSAGRLQLDGPLDRALAGAAEEEGVHLVGLQVPLGTKGVPGHVLGLIRACRGAVLVHRDTL